MPPSRPARCTSRTRSRRRHSVTMRPRSSSANASCTSRRPPRRAPWTSPSVRNAAGAICRGSNVGGSVSLEGASVGYGQSSSTTHKFSVRRVSETVVQATGLVSGTKGSDWSISGGLSDTKGSSATKGFEATWEFDLGTGSGKAAFELFAQSGMPPFFGATLKSDDQQWLGGGPRQRLHPLDGHGPVDGHDVGGRQDRRRGHPRAIRRAAGP